MGSERGRARGLVVVVAALLPLCFAVWLLWQSFEGGQDPAAASSPGSGAQDGRDQQAGGTSDGSGGIGQSDKGTPHDEPGRGGEKAGPGGKDGSGGSDGAGDRGTGHSEDAGRKPLDGRVVVLDPGHNPGNRDHTTEINRQVEAGGFRKECDTTGTTTNDGYPEASFTLDVARRARKILSAQGATVTFTQDGDRAWGPCVDERARTGNRAHADAAVSIHADGSAPGNHGFHVIVPGSVRSSTADTRTITGPSRSLGEQIKKYFAASTSQPPANYIAGGSGLTVRKDLGGLNLSKVPKVFIECGNMRDSDEAARLRSPSWRQRAAEGIADGVSAFLVKGS